jgi:hypothetical protein
MTEFEMKSAIQIKFFLDIQNNGETEVKLSQVKSNQSFFGVTL